MTTKTEMVATLKTENPTLRQGDDEAGYETLSSLDYNIIISDWADNRLAKEKAAIAAELQAEAKATQKAALLARLGITADEAKLLIG